MKALLREALEELLERLATLVPPPRKHRHLDHAVAAPHTPLRPAVTARAGWPPDGSTPAAMPRAMISGETGPKRASPGKYPWAMLLARIGAVLPPISPASRAEMRLIAAATAREPVQRIRYHGGEPLPPPISPGHSPPEAETFNWDQSTGEAADGREPTFESAAELQVGQIIARSSVRFPHPTPPHSPGPGHEFAR